ncbi:hypothetical protein EGW08_000752 [Elysia chlorotica]|uniref:Uncharacterized protein n=1 Tax=Elysia chlorotica TaxID=188477 RepID=A0A3S1CFN7_ELYCH|nr:hypothetical protein EGW08_000752 [Elysia chlorotica]
MSFQKMRMFLISVTAIPQKDGVDLRFLQKLANMLTDYSTATRVLYKFKVTGESKLLSVVQVSNVIGLERVLSGLNRLGEVEVTCQPIISYESFARRCLEVDEHLTGVNSGTLAKEGLYWLEFNIDYQGKSTDELINVWKKEAEAVLTSRHKEGTLIELYKVVAERKVHAFINTLDPEQLDSLALQLPIMKENGASVKINCKALQLMDDYSARILSETI